MTHDDQKVSYIQYQHKTLGIQFICTNITVLISRRTHIFTFCVSLPVYRLQIQTALYTAIYNDEVDVRIQVNVDPAVDDFHFQKYIEFSLLDWDEIKFIQKSHHGYKAIIV